MSDGIEISRAQVGDAAVLAKVAAKTFLEDNKLKPKGASPEGPPGHDDPATHLHMINNCVYYKAKLQERILGGGMFWINRDGQHHIDLMFIDPEYQGRGVGSRLLARMLGNHPSPKGWSLGTPSFSKRNHHFYSKHGFIKTGEEETGMGWKEFFFHREPL